MRNMLAFFAAMLLTVAGVGWYLGWYTIHSAPAAGGQRSVTVDFNTAKIGQDLRAAEEKIQQELAERSRQRQKEASKAAPSEAKSGAATWFQAPELRDGREERKAERDPVLWVDDGQ